jgi:hypothetical protein
MGRLYPAMVPFVGFLTLKIRMNQNQFFVISITESTCRPVLFFYHSERKSLKSQNKAFNGAAATFTWHTSDPFLSKGQFVSHFCHRKVVGG